MSLFDNVFKRTPRVMHYVPADAERSVCGLDALNELDYSIEPTDDVTCAACKAAPEYQAQRMEDALMAKTAVHYHLGADAGLACGVIQVAGVRLSDNIRRTTCRKCLDSPIGKAARAQAMEEALKKTTP